MDLHVAEILEFVSEIMAELKRTQKMQFFWVY